MSSRGYSFEISFYRDGTYEITGKMKVDINTSLSSFAKIGDIYVASDTVHFSTISSVIADALRDGNVRFINLSLDTQIMSTWIGAVRCEQGTANVEFSILSADKQNQSAEIRFLIIGNVPSTKSEENQNA